MILSSNKLKNSILNIDESKSNIPNKLKKYLNDKIIDKSYIDKLSILLSSNDKNYKLKRTHINKLSSFIDENNKEYLSELKYNNISSSKKNKLNESSTSIKRLKINQKLPSLLTSKNTINDNNELNNEYLSDEEFPFFLNDNLEYFRTPKVIINNEKLMFEFFKKKNILIDKIPYLSRNRNDLIINDYKKKKNTNSNEDKSNNNITNTSNYLKNFILMSKMKKIYIKKIHPYKKKKNYSKNKNSSCPSSFIKNSKNIIRIKRDILPSIRSKKKSMKMENDNNSNNITSNEENKTKNLEQYKKINKLSNTHLLKKLKMSVQNYSLNLGKVNFSDGNKSRNSNKIVFLFPRDLSSN